MIKNLILALIAIVVMTGFFVWKNSVQEIPAQVATIDADSTATSSDEILLEDKKVTIVASVTCGCCKLYSQYLRENGFDVDLQEKSPDEVATFKNENGVPESLRSCHTAKFGKYIVEGHVPLEAIEKLFQEKPDIKGIGMAGMPIGSPGMPGKKDAPFEINVISNEGLDVGLFLKI